jgi:hypothetical protein
MDFEEFASALQRAFDDCKVVERVTRFTNFTETVEPYLNTASKTDGADHFNEFRFVNNYMWFYDDHIHESVSVNICAYVYTCKYVCIFLISCTIFLF